MSHTIRNITAAAALAALAVAQSACGDPAETSGQKQTITGAIDTTTFDAPVLGVRALRAGEIVATAPLRAGGAFSVEVPTGQGYRLEVVTRDGSLALGSAGAGTMQAREFDVCAPIASFHVGAIRRWTGGGEGGDRPDGEPPDSGGGSEPWPGDPDGNGDCGGGSGGGGGGGGSGGGGSDPGHPDDCGCDEPPRPCLPGEDPTTDDCWEDPCWENPELCDPCELDPRRCECPEGTRPGPDGTCWPDDEPPPPPCDPADPESCEDPCASDPRGCDPCDVDPWMCECPDGWHTGPDGTCWPDEPPPPPCDPTFPDSCGECPDGTRPAPDGTCWPDDPECPYDDPMCWPEPPPCEDADADGRCDGDGGCYAEQEVPDFGCE